MGNGPHVAGGGGAIYKLTEGVVNFEVVRTHLEDKLILDGHLLPFQFGLTSGADRWSPRLCHALFGKFAVLIQLQR